MNPRKKRPQLTPEILPAAVTAEVAAAFPGGGGVKEEQLCSHAQHKEREKQKRSNSPSSEVHKVSPMTPKRQPKEPTWVKMVHVMEKLESYLHAQGGEG